MYQIGIDIGGTNVKIGLLNEALELCAEISIPFPHTTAEDMAAQIRAAVGPMLQARGAALSDVESLGAVVPGSIDAAGETVVDAHNLNFHNVPLRKILSDAFPGIPVYIANDANGAALAELYTGAFVGCKTGVLLTLGTGLGGGIILNGKMFNGGMNHGVELGDGPSHVVLEQLGHEDDSAKDQLAYLTRTKDGKILKSSSVYIRDESGKVSGILGINYDISMMQLFENSLHDFISADQHASREPERITLNVADLLDDLIRQADELVGKPVALMTKDDKVKAIRYLSNSGALLITKSGDKIAKHFGISKYTLYSYLDNSKTGGTNEL